MKIHTQMFTCLREFHEAVSATSLKMAICGCCARKLNVRDFEMIEMAVTQIQNQHRLKPFIRHPNQYLINDMLLEETALWMAKSGEVWTRMCIQCRKGLEGGKDRPPMHALANGLWIGNVPIELSCLTLPESLLISLVYQRIFVCKLWPKDRRGAQTESLQNALVGNVTSFELNLEEVSKMVEGNMMPRKAAILPYLISITFVSRKGLCKNWLKKTFRVRRGVVLNAIRWLKVNNPRFYGGVTIDEEALSFLPEDDIPNEILGTIQHEEEEEVLDKENNGYVPQDEDDNGCETETREAQEGHQAEELDSLREPTETGE